MLGFFGVKGFANTTIATIKSGRISTEQLKNYYPLPYLLDLVDYKILNNKYELKDEQKAEIDKIFNKELEDNKNFLEENGFNTADNFKNFLILNYKRNLYLTEYLKTKIPQEEIKKFYDEKVYGEINSKYIFVPIKDPDKDPTGKKAFEMANNIIKKLTTGISFEDVSKEFKDKNNIIFKDVGYQGFTSGLPEEYINAAKELGNGTYSKEPVKTKYGYYVIYKVDQKEKLALEEVEDDIVQILGQSLDENETYMIADKALIQLRKENKLNITDKILKKKYEKYCSLTNSNK